MGNVSPEFKAAVQWAIAQAQVSDDEPVRFAINYIPVYADTDPTPQQAVAGGCATCTYLGLWSDEWPGYPKAAHGTIWLFERGIREQAMRESRGDLYAQTLATLLHEIDHALQRDHVLEHLGQVKQAAAMARPLCGSCGG